MYKDLYESSTGIEVLEYVNKTIDKQEKLRIKYTFSSDNRYAKRCINSFCDSLNHLNHYNYQYNNIMIELSIIYMTIYKRAYFFRNDKYYLQEPRRELRVLDKLFKKIDKKVGIPRKYITSLREDLIDLELEDKLGINPVDLYQVKYCN